MHLRKAVSHFPPPVKTLLSYENISIDLQQNMCILILIYFWLVECYILKSRSGFTTKKKHVINMSKNAFLLCSACAKVMNVQKKGRKILNPTFRIDRK